MAGTRREGGKSAGQRETAPPEVAAAAEAATPAARGSGRRPGVEDGQAKAGATDRPPPEARTPGVAAAKTVATPWGAARLVDELWLPQEAGDRHFASLVQLLETPDGERLVRFAYATDDTARRGPVTLRRSDVTRLRQELGAHDGLRAALDA